MFNIDEIKEIITTVDKSGLNKFEIKQGEFHLVLTKVKVATETCSDTMPLEVQETVVGVKSSTAEYGEIKAPMVGTFYTASEQGAEQFVEIGTKIKEDSVVCILEAMKLFTEIEAEIKGEIVEILANDGELVEYGQPLFKVKIS